MASDPRMERAWLLVQRLARLPLNTERNKHEDDTKLLDRIIEGAKEIVTSQPIGT